MDAEEDDGSKDEGLNVLAVDEESVPVSRSERASAPETATGVRPAVSEDPRAWVVIEGESPPPDWAERAAEAWVVRLVPSEVREILTEKATRPALDESELRLARLVARGVTTHKIATELHVDHRTVQRQVARLRQKLGVRSKAELAALLAEAGL